MPSRSRVTAAAVTLFVLGTALCAHAQSMRVRVTEETTGRPLAGSLVDVLDAKDAVAVQGVLSSEGTRQLLLPAPGTYRVRLRRIGYQPFVGAPVTVAAASTVDVTLLAPDQRVVLSGIRVLGRRCSHDAFDDPGLSTLWEGVRTALTTTLLSRTDTTTMLEVRAFHRTLNAGRDVMEEIVGLPRVTRSQRPYAAARSAAALSRDGYAYVTPEESNYFAPDERVLLSDEFLSDHCFEVMRGSDATAGLLGVHFSPSDRRSVTDISGTLWVDSASAALRYLDFWYEQNGLPRAARGEDRSGGQVVFMRTPAGMWIVGAWRLRLPRLTSRLAQRGNGARAVLDVLGYEEVGGVLRSGVNDTVPPPTVLIPYLDLLAPARITGAVYDSLAGRPLADARVWLVPSEPKAIVDMGLAPAGGRVAVTAAASTSDAAGRFSFDGVPAGPYRLVFEHPSLDSLGIAIPRYDILLKPGSRVIADVGSPSRRTLWDGCARVESPSAGADGLVLGTVRAAGDQRPLVDALVRATWVVLSASVVGTARTYSVETRTNADGGYRLCGVPDSTFALVQAAGPHSSTGRVQARIGSLGIAHVDLRLAEIGEGEAPLAPGVVAGIVTDSIQQPISNVQLAFDGLTVTGRSDDAGRFRLTDVMPGTQTLEVRRVGLDAVRRVVDIGPGATTTLALTLTKTQLLEAMIVTAQRNRNTAELNDAIRRHRAGSGTILLEEEIAKRSSIQSLLQGLSGVRVVQTQGSTPWVAMMRKGATECIARLFIDGHENDYDYLTTMSPDQVAIVEVFVHGALAPIFTAGRSIFGRDEQCGVILFWLKH